MLLPLLAKKHETERESERKEREKQGVETITAMCAQVFVMH